MPRRRPSYRRSARRRAHGLTAPLATVLALGVTLTDGVTSTALAQQYGRAVLDTDGDGRLERTEFLLAFGPDALGRLDLYGDDELGEGEFGRALFRLWDDDGSGALSIDEWDDGVDRWFGEDPADLEVSEWDADGDGTIAPAEFEAALGTTELFGSLDLGRDGTLNAPEFGSGVFDAGDSNRDGFLDAGSDRADDGADEDGFLANLAEALFTSEDEPFEPDQADVEPDGDGPTELADAEPDGDVADSIDPINEPPADGTPLIERGEPFTALPVPCGQEGCEATAAAFCEALGYEPPIGTLARGSSLYVIRCADEI